MSVSAVLLCALLCLASCSAEGTEASQTQIASLFDAFSIPNASPPYDSVRIKVLYPELETPENETSILPVVIFSSGGIVEANRYQWLAERIVREAGVIFVLYDFLIDLNGTVFPFPGTPIGMFGLPTPEPILIEMLSKLEQLNVEGPLAGRLNLNRVIFGGHSAGGAVALLNSDETLFPEIVGVFAYGTNLLVPSDSGDPSGSVRQVNGSVPVLLIGGELDGVHVANLARLGIEVNSAIEPTERTYNEAFDPGRPVCFVEFLGFNHMSIVDPVDTTAGTAVQNDFEATVDKETMKDEISLLILLFVFERGHDDFAAGEELRRIIEDGNPYIGLGDCSGY